MDFDNIKKSNYISNAIMISDMSIKFETLFNDNRVQAYFKNLNLSKEFIACQALMSPALFRMQNSQADFTNQKAFIKDQTIAAKIEVVEEVHVAEAETKIGGI